MPERLHPRVPMQRMVTVGSIEAKHKFKFARKRKFKRPHRVTHQACRLFHLISFLTVLLSSRPPILDGISYNDNIPSFFYQRTRNLKNCN